MGVLRRLRREARGQAAIELAVILPLIAALMFGVVEIAKGYNYWVDQTHMASEMGRFVATDWFPGCSPTTTGPCSGKTMVSYVSLLADTSELRNSSTGTEVANCAINQSLGDKQTPVKTGKGEVPCKLRFLFCWPVAGTQGKIGDPIRVTLQSIYRVKIAHVLLRSVAPDIKVRGSSTVRLERPIDLTRIGVASIPNCT